MRGKIADAVDIIGRFLAFLIVLAIFGLVIMWLLALAGSLLTGCHVSGANVQPCLIGDVDIGGLLYHLAMAGFGIVYYAPIGFLTILGLTVIRLVVRIVLVQLWRDDGASR